MNTERTQTRVMKMKKLPEGWERVKLGELINKGKIKLFRGKVISKDDMKEFPGDYPVYSSSVQNNGLLGYYGKYMFEEELVSWSVDGGGNFFYRPKHKYSLTNVVGYMRVLDSKFLSYKYLYLVLYFEHKRKVFDYQTKAHPSVIKELYSINLLPLSEQRKIAEILSVADEAIEKTDQIIEKYKRIKRGLMQDLLTKGIDENGQIRSEETHKFKDSLLGRVPEEWEVVTVSDFASNEKNAIVDGPFGSNLKIEHYREVGRPVVQSGFVTSNKFVADKYLYVDESKFRSEIRSRVLPGDIVMAKIGAQCGTCAILPDNHPIGILAGNCLKITVSRNNLNKFLEILLHYYYKLGKLELVISTTAQPAISMSSLKKVLIPRPNIMEQHHIAKILSSLDDTIEKEQNYKEKLERIKHGKVRVNHLINN